MRKERIRNIIAGTVALAIAVSAAFLIFSRQPTGRGELRRTAPKGRIAIVLDGWGYSVNNLALAEGLGYPLTASILPNLRYSRKLAEELHNSGFEIILHLPMEPKENYSLEKNTITTFLGEAAIKKIVDEDLSGLLYADGANNHMGSRATEDRRTMLIVFEELKKRGCFFLDSYVTSQSVCPDLAREVGIRFAKRDIFLDSGGDADYIKQQVNKLKLRAKSRGAAIGIGHDRKTTLEVLKAVMPLLEKEGYRFVYLSELVK